MTPTDHERLASWATTIVAELLPGARHRDSGGNRVFRPGGLSIHLGTGAWYSHSAGQGGRSPIGLIMFLSGLDHDSAVAWAEHFLKAHHGGGPCVGGDDDGHPGSRAEAEEIGERLVDVIGSPAEAYLRSRGLAPPYPSCVAYLPHARLGEGATVGKLTSNGKIVGYQFTFVDPYGRKSVVEPIRRRLMLQRCPEASFEVPADGGIIITEGLEDLLSIATLKRPERLIGAPGVATLQHLKMPKGTSVIVVRDGDEPDSPADAALRRGLDALILQKADVDLTPTPVGQDANSILQADGPSALAALIDRAAPAGLSRDGVLKQAATLDPPTYEEQRQQIAKKLGMRVGKLDEFVKALRAEAPKSKDDPADDILDDDVDLAETLDGILAQLHRYIVAEDHLLGTAALWAAHTHLTHHDKVHLTVSPRLAIQARDAGCGKTVLLEALAVLVANSRMAASVTASSVLRIVGLARPTFMLDEADLLLRTLNPNSDLLAVLNASHRRSTAFVERSVPTPDGKDWTVERFSVWCAMALAGIGELPRQQQERALIIHLHKALAKDVPEHLADGTSPELQLLAKKLRTWAAYLDELPRPEMPEILMRQAGRVCDNWRPLLAVAELAGGRWPKLALDAVTKAIEAEKRPSRIQRLLTSIRNAFDEQREGLDFTTGKSSVTGPFTELSTKALIDALLADEDEEWGTANRGRPVTAYWLRDNLRDLLDPPGSQQWWTDETEKRDGKEVAVRYHHRGYRRVQFEKAFATYLTEIYTPKPLKTSGSSGLSASSGSDDTTNLYNPNVYGGAGYEPDQNLSLSSGSEFGNGHAIEIPKEPTSHEPDEPGEPGEPDVLEGERVYTEGNPFPLNVEEVARQLAAENPTWSIQRIAKALGQPERRIAQYLPDHNPKPNKPSRPGKRDKRVKVSAIVADPNTATATEVSVAAAPERPRTDVEIDRVVRILRDSGPLTTTALYTRHKIYLQTLTAAEERGLLKRGQDNLWSTAP